MRTHTYIVSNHILASWVPCERSFTTKVSSPQKKGLPQTSTLVIFATHQTAFSPCIPHTWTTQPGRLSGTLPILKDTFLPMYYHTIEGSFRPADNYSRAGPDTSLPLKLWCWGTEAWPAQGWIPAAGGSPLTQDILRASPLFHPHIHLVGSVASVSLASVAHPPFSSPLIHLDAGPPSPPPTLLWGLLPVSWSHCLLTKTPSSPTALKTWSRDSWGVPEPLPRDRWGYKTLSIIL